MQCKSGCAQAGQNKKRRADARLSWDGVEKLAIGLLLNQNGIDDISAGLFTIFVQCKTDISALDFNILCTGDIREQLSTIQLVLNSLLALIGVAGVQIGVAGNSVSKLVLIQLLDECFIDAGAFLSGIDTPVEKRLLTLQPVNMEAPATATADRPATFRKERRDRIMVVSS